MREKEAEGVVEGSGKVSGSFKGWRCEGHL